MWKLRIIFTICLLLAKTPVLCSAYSYSLENDLRTLIFTTNSYQKLARPSSTVEVNITLSIITFNAVNVRDQSLTTTGYFNFKWSDRRLDWSNNPTYNNDIKVFYSNEDYIWRPPMIVENSIDDVSVMSDAAIPIRVSNDGSITWDPSGIFKTQCETDVTYYPFDTQTCDIILSTWGYTASEITLTLASSPLDFTYFKENGEWAYSTYSTSSSSASREGKSFSQLTFSLTLKRRPAYHVLNTLIPTVLLAFLSCMAFKLPPESGERIGYSLTVLLSYAVYLTLVADNIPTTSVNTSLLSVYLVFILALGMISVLLTILVLECHHTEPETEVPPWLLKVLHILIAFTFQKRHGRRFYCCCSSCIKRNNVTSTEDDTDVSKPPQKQYMEGEKEIQYSWMEISRILDKSFIRIYLCTVTIMTICFLLTLIIGYATY